MGSLVFPVSIRIAYKPFFKKRIDLRIDKMVNNSVFESSRNDFPRFWLKNNKTMDFSWPPFS